MPSLKTEAQDYEPTTIKNIAELDKVDVLNAVITEERQDKQGKSYTIRYITVNGEDYRVPISVISALKEILTEKPTLKHFKVKKSGKDLNTNYTVIPID
jgi:hypothetical protein